MINREKLPGILQQPEIRMALHEAGKGHCPEPLEYTEGATLEDWAYSSGIRVGYALAYKHLGVEID